VALVSRIAQAGGAWLGTERAFAVFRTFLLISGALFVLCSPVLLNIYDYHDSFHFFVWSPSCPRFALLPYLLVIGRPLIAAAYCLTAPPLMGGIETAGLVRAEGLLVMSAAATMLHYWLRDCGLGRFASAFGAVFCFVLPGPVQFVYASHATPMTWAFVFTIGAASLVVRMVAAMENGQPFAARRFAVAAIASLVISSLIYQLVSETFLALVFVRMLGRRGRAANFLLWSGLVFALHVAAYLVLNYAVVIPIVVASGRWSVQQIFNDERGLYVFGNGLGASAGIVAQRSLRAVTLWFFGSGWMVASAIAAFSAALYIAAAAELWRKIDSFHARIGAVATPALLFVAFAAMTNLLAAARPDGLMLLFRTMIAYQWVVLFLLLHCASTLEQRMADSGVAVGAVYAALAIAIGGFVTWNLYDNFVRPNAEEAAYLRRVMSEDRSRLGGAICVVQPDVPWIGSYAYPMIDEFGKTTSMYPQDEKDLLIEIGQSIGVPRGVIKPPVVYRGTKPPDVTCDATIDMGWVGK